MEDRGRGSGGGKHATIEPAHLFIGLLSLGKVVDDSETADVDAIATEVGILNGVLERVKLDATKVRRRIRSFLGMGDTPNDGSPISRSAECKKAFQRAKEIAGAPASSLALMAALLENPDPAIQSALERSNVLPKLLREELLRMNLEGDQRRRGVGLHAGAVRKRSDTAGGGGETRAGYRAARRAPPASPNASA